MRTQPPPSAVRARLARSAVLVAVYLAVWLASLALALDLVSGRAALGVRALPLVLLILTVKGGAALWSGSFRELWQHAGMEDLAALIKTAIATTAAITLVIAVLPLGVSPIVGAIDGAIGLVALAGLRVAPHLIYELRRDVHARRRRRVILAGRRDFVDLELRRMHVRENGDHVIGLVLEGPELAGSMLRRVPVLSRDRLEEVLQHERPSAVVLVPPASAGFTSEMEELCALSSVECHSIASLAPLGDVVESAAVDLLAREPAPFDAKAVSTELVGKTVLVTGAGGSIGSELAHQIASFGPKVLVLVDRSENALFRIEHALHDRHLSFPVIGRIVDVRDRAAVKFLFEEFRPQVVFHAAAHKHVPLMERHPAEAVLNNVMGTRVLVDAADAHGVRSFVFVSTDKAVHPSSVMGATKRLGELYVRAMSRTSSTRFMAVRFGNVLGSSGSVLPIFVEQIERGGPVTVTHPEMSRFFMSIPEACRLVLEAAVIGTGGELFVLEMGQPVKIVDLARRLIERAGLRPDEDIPIVFSGTRPGEKLQEELVFGEESTSRTQVPGIYVVATHEVPRARLTQAILELEAQAYAGEDLNVIRMMSDIMPEYRPNLPKVVGASDSREAASS